MKYDYYLQGVKKLVNNLSQILGDPIEIRNSEGGIVGCEIPESNIQRTIYQMLFKMVAASGNSQVVEIPGGEQVWGIPIMLNSEELKTIVVCHSRSFDLTPLNGANYNTLIDEEAEQSNPHPLIALLEEILKGLSDNYLGEIEMESFASELSLRYEELNFLYKIGAKIEQVGNVKQFLHYILRKSMELVDADYAFIHIPTKRIINSVNLCEEKCPDDTVDDQRIRKVSFEIRKILRGDLKYLTERDLKSYPSISSYFDKYSTALIIPIRFQEKVEGVLLFSKVHASKGFTTGDKRLITLTSDIISIKITNVELFQGLHNFLMSLMKSFVVAIEEKDIYTRGHSERVNRCALKIGNALDLDENEMKSLNFASLLHDIGKIGIPEEGILNKPGPLTDEEFSVITQHPVKGYKILKPIKQLKDCLPGILYHHERLDGKGYPKGIPGSKIPLYARIIAVADTYDAMTSNRAYRRAMSLQDVKQEMMRVSGTQLDSEITQIFINSCLGKKIKKAV